MLAEIWCSPPLFCLLRLNQTTNEVSLRSCDSLINAVRSFPLSDFSPAPLISGGYTCATQRLGCPVERPGWTRPAEGADQRELWNWV